MQNLLHNHNNIRYIPTPHNYFTQTNNTLKRLKHQGNISRLLILALIIWNIILTVIISQPITRANIPQFTDLENQMITQLEEI